ncbi:MAG: protein kinase domain-containing protein [Actinomycetes bacterium]
MSDASRLLAGRYRLSHPLGRGGMGEVWQAHDEVLERPVAVKMLDLSSATDPHAAERFRREAQMVASLSHPHIITVYDTGTEGETAYLVMELLSGPSLSDTLREHGALPVGETVLYAEQTASALAAAHAAGVVHRDVKPANLMLASDGSLRVLDFGIARLLEQTGQTALTATQTVVGTADYLSPEQARGVQVDARADLYALGCVLVALLTGSPPFRGDTPVAVLGQHIYTDPPRLADLRPDVPPWLDTLVADLLAKDPDARPPSAQAVADRLRAREAGAFAPTAAMPAGAVPAGGDRTAVLPAGAVPDDSRRATGRSGRGRRVAGVLAGLAAGVAAVLLVLALTNPGEGERTGGPTDETSPAQSPQATPTRNSPSPTPTKTTPTSKPTPTEEKPSVDPAVAAVADVRNTIDQEVAAGGLEDKDAQRLRDGVSKVEEKLAADDSDGAADETDKLTEELDKLEQTQKIEPDSRAGIQQKVDELAASL